MAVIFEGRDTAGKGRRDQPDHVALPAPSDREKTQIYMQRYIAHFPAAGEIILFDRSWYNRAGVERVMGFCTEDRCEHFLLLVPPVEREMVVRNGIILRKYFLDISQDEQRRRFEARIDDPIKHWKLSPMDVESVRRLWDYTAAYQRMIEATHTPEAPWYIIQADDKRRARLNLIRHLLDSIGRRRPTEDSQGAAATEGCNRGSGRRKADPQSLLTSAPWEGGQHLRRNPHLNSSSRTMVRR
jgi:polyphosphate kinase 2